MNEKTRKYLLIAGVVLFVAAALWSVLGCNVDCCKDGKCLQNCPCDVKEVK